MVAYSFKARFAPLIVSGAKRQTIRAERKRPMHHAQPGQMIQLYTGMRTASCVKICPDVRCVDVQPCVIWLYDCAITRINVGHVPVRNLNAFASRDGFRDINDMSTFWVQNHGPELVFRGVVIEWDPPLSLGGAA